MSTAYDIEARKTSTWMVDPAHTSVEFAAKHMVITSVRSRFASFDIDLDFDEEHLERSSVEARIDAASIDTKVADRDAHLKDFGLTWNATLETGGVLVGDAIRIILEVEAVRQK